MALVTTCPDCGQRIINNGEDCPFCGYSIAKGKSKAQMEQELLEAEEALRAEEEAKAAAEAEARAAEEARLAAEAEQARIAEEQARLAQEQARAAAQQNGIFAKFQKKTVARPQTDLNGKVNDMDNLPSIPESSDSSFLPPMQLDRPVPLSTIANTEAVPLTPTSFEVRINT